jgi:DNA invertase Pin-like site-specific DNA recombinase
MILCLHSLWENLNLQKDALIKYGVDERNIFQDKTSGSKDKRIGLDKAIEFLKDGDTLVVWKLDRLGRSLAQFKRSLIQERLKTGLESAKLRSIRGRL